MTSVGNSGSISVLFYVH